MKADIHNSIPINIMSFGLPLVDEEVSILNIDCYMDLE